jgi:hypothetical protein
MQTQSCLQLAEEAEKEHKKVAEKISESADEMKVPLYRSRSVLCLIQCSSRAQAASLYNLSPVGLILTL